jgi:hypothetical protein
MYQNMPILTLDDILRCPPGYRQEGIAGLWIGAGIAGAHLSSAFDQQLPQCPLLDRENLLSDFAQQARPFFLGDLPRIVFFA